MQVADFRSPPHNDPHAGGQIQERRDAHVRWRVCRGDLAGGPVHAHRLEEDLPLEVARDFIGGAGLGIKYLFDEVPGNRPAGLRE